MTRPYFWWKPSKPVFLKIRNLPEDQLAQVMGIACPQIVYPYLRGNVADMVQRAGFPPVHLQELNFQAIYEQQRKNALEQAANTNLPQ